MTQEDAYNELCCYTLTHGDPAFIHQLVVDAAAAQFADEQTKPIKLTFALVGLYLHLEKQFTGKEVQHAHMALARKKRIWPTFPQPQDRDSVTAADVLAVPAGPERDRAIEGWCASVWEAYSGCREGVIAVVREHGIV